MSAPASRPSAFSFLRLFWIAVATVAGCTVLLAVVLPLSCGSIRGSKVLQGMSNGRQVWAAARLDDPAHAAYPATMPVATATAYFTELVRAGSLKESDLRILAGPRHPMAQTVAALSEQNIAFTVYRIGPDDPPQTIFLVSKPGVFAPLDPGFFSRWFDNQPERRVVVHKDGSTKAHKVSEPLESLGPLPRAVPPTLLP